MSQSCIVSGRGKLNTSRERGFGSRLSVKRVSTPVVVHPLEVGSGISGGLLLDCCNLMAPILTLGLDNAGRFLVDKENIVGWTNIRPILTSGDPETSAEVDFVVVLNYPTRIG